MILTYCHQVMETRPMWTRSALLNQFSAEEVKLLDRYVFIISRMPPPQPTDRTFASQQKSVHTVLLLYVSRQLFERNTYPLELRSSQRSKFLYVCDISRACLHLQSLMSCIYHQLSKGALPNDIQGRQWCASTIQASYRCGLGSRASE